MTNRREHIAVGWLYAWSASDRHPIRLVEWNEATGLCRVESTDGIQWWTREGRLRQMHAMPPRDTRGPDVPPPWWAWWR